MYHSLLVLGFAGGDADLRYTPNGKEVATFSVATSRIYTDAAGKKATETNWFRVTAWGRQAIIASERVKTGSRVFVVGRLQPDPKTGGPRVWIRQSDGLPAANYDLLAVDIRVIDISHSARTEEDDSVPLPLEDMSEETA